MAPKALPTRRKTLTGMAAVRAAYGRWYERNTNATAKVVNDAGGINGRPIEIVAEDDGADPNRSAV